jgi:hypothetical protein
MGLQVQCPAELGIKLSGLHVANKDEHLFRGVESVQWILLVQI